MHGLTGRVLHVDLSRRRSRVEVLPEEFWRTWMGGNGVAARLLYDLMPPGTDPLSPEAPLILAPGTLNGTPIPWAAKFCAAGRSPLSGTFMDSLSSSPFGPELRCAGYDALVITGASPTPVSLLVEDGEARFLDAAHLWGTDCFEAEARLQEDLDDPRLAVLTIGPAGERGVKFAAIMGQRRALGTGGLGTLMGSKRLKALAARGSGLVRVADAEGLFREVKELRASLEDRPAAKVLSTYGTAVHTRIMQALGGFPTRNFQAGTFEEAEGLAGELLYATYVKKNLACRTCLTPCGHLAVVEEGPHAGACTLGPDFQGIGALGSLQGIGDMAAVIHADELTDRFGVNQISAGNVIAFAMECFESGRITAADTDGLELRFGDAGASLELLRRIAWREGAFATLLGEGVKKAGEALGAEDLAMHVKGLEMASFDPRHLRSQAIGYSVANRGPNHCEVRPLSEFFGMDDWSDPEVAGRQAKELSDWSAVANSVGWCLSAERMVSHRLTPRVARWVELVTGWPVTVEELHRLGERVQSLERAFNVREGFRRRDDRLPRRLVREPLGHHRLTQEELDRMISGYYAHRGWDEDGVPTPEHLRAVGGLEDVARDLEGLAQAP